MSKYYLVHGDNKKGYTVKSTSEACHQTLMVTFSCFKLESDC